MDGLLDSGGDGRLVVRESEAIARLLRCASSDISATEGDCRGEFTFDMEILAGSSPMKGGSRGVVACKTLGSWSIWFALLMSIGRASETLGRPSTRFAAGEGGICKLVSRRTVELTGFAAMEDALELARDREIDPELSGMHFDFHFVDRVDNWELIREIPLKEELSERLLSEG